MATTVLSAALQGVTAVPVEVEVDLIRRLPAVSIVGLPASAVRESAERVRSALDASGEEFPRKRVVINLAPADLRKEGTALDLPMALGILAADDRIPAAAAAGILAAGELSLDGRLRPIRGALSLAIAARERGLTLILPTENALQAAVVPGVRIWMAEELVQVIEMLRGDREPMVPRSVPSEPPRHGPDMSEVKGQYLARRALELAAAGAHHLLLVGPPGCGKSMLAKRLPSILPPMAFEEALETTRVHSAAKLGPQGGGIIACRPFRAPHHTATVAGMVGDRNLKPGEIPLAHNGVLFLDEAPEFRRSALEVLREPLENGTIQLSRALATVEFPAAITLVMAANRCPCGNRGSSRACLCTVSAIQKYERKLSGPIVDRIDLHVELRPVGAEQLLGGEPGEPSESIRARVVAARERQSARGQVRPNGQLPDEQLDDLAPLTEDCRALLLSAAGIHQLSARSTRRIHKVARTIADLRGAEQIESADLEEALHFRPLTQ